MLLRRAFATTVVASTARLAALGLVVLTSACGGDSPDSGGPDSGAEPGATPGSAAGGSPGALLSADPVDQINVMLAGVVMPIPGEPIETRYQVRLLEGDSIAIDFDQREGGSDWFTSATAVGTVVGLGTEPRRERGIDFVCGLENCFEYRAPLDELNLARLPEGADRDWFTGLLAEIGSGQADVEASGGLEAINQRLRASAIRYSDIVTSWYQVSFVGDWLYLETWQHTEGFPEQDMRGWRAVHLPGLAPADGSDVVPCRELGCVLDVDFTPVRFVMESPEDAQRMMSLLAEVLQPEG